MAAAYHVYVCEVPIFYIKASFNVKPNNRCRVDIRRKGTVLLITLSMHNDIILLILLFGNRLYCTQLQYRKIN